MFGRAGKETENDAQEWLQNPPSLASLFDYVTDWSQPSMYIVHCPGQCLSSTRGKSLGTRLWDDHPRAQSRSPSLRSSGRNGRLWDNPFQGGIWLAVEMGCVVQS
jgi:hypothetical protein